MNNRHYTSIHNVFLHFFFSYLKLHFLLFPLDPSAPKDQVQAAPSPGPCTAFLPAGIRPLTLAAFLPPAQDKSQHLSTWLKVLPLKFQLYISLCFKSCLLTSLNFYINGISLKLLRMHQFWRICRVHNSCSIMAPPPSTPQNTSEYEPYSFINSLIHNCYYYYWFVFLFNTLICLWWVLFTIFVR